MTRATALRTLGALATTAVVLIALVSLGRSTSLEEIARVLRSADAALLAVGALPVLALVFLLRAARASALLRDASGARPRLGDVAAAVVLGHAANNVLPFRAGEVVRARHLVTRGHPVERVVAAQLLEKAIELVSMAVLVTPFVAHDLAERVPLAWVAAGAIALLVAAIVVRRLRGARAWIARATDWSRGDLAASLVWALLTDAAEFALIALTARSLGIPLGVGASVSVFAAVNLAIALPSTPGNIGALEAGAAVALVALGCAHEAAIAFALLYRLVQWVPVTLAGAALALTHRAPADVPITNRSAS